MQQANSSLDRLYGALRSITQIAPADLGQNWIPAAFIEALHDDLNTPKALAELFALAKRANVEQDQTKLAQIKSALLQSGELLGLLQQDPNDWFVGESSSIDVALVEALIEQRNQAKANKDWSNADSIRDRLSEMNVVLEDGADGTTWKIQN